MGTGALRVGVIPLPGASRIERAVVASQESAPGQVERIGYQFAVNLVPLPGLEPGHPV